MATQNLTNPATNPRYLIIGDGRVARHFEHYFTLLRLPTQTWSRKQNSEADLREWYLTSDVTLVLISDAQIEEFLREHPFLDSKPRVHFSGSLTTSLAFGAHPLMAFPAGRYSLETYKQIPFICEKGSFNFKYIFPKLENPHYEIDRAQKPLYHALCVLAGNFTTILWQKLFAEFSNQFDLPPEAARPYLQQVTNNLLHHPEHALTGPLARKDSKTLSENLRALQNDPFHDVYLAFVKAHLPQLAKELE